MPIDWATKHFFTFQTLQNEGVVVLYLSYNERTRPQRVKLAVLAFILSEGISFQNPVTNLKVVHLCFSVKSILDPLLMSL